MKRNQLRARIVELHQNQVHFAKTLGVSDAVVSRVINGLRPLTEEEAQIWAEKLDCLPSDLMTPLTI